MSQEPEGERVPRNERLFKWCEKVLLLRSFTCIFAAGDEREM